MKTIFLRSDLEITRRTVVKIKEFIDDKGLLKLSFDKTIQAIDLILNMDEKLKSKE